MANSKTSFKNPATSQKLVQGQTQKLVMTQQLRQGITILQFGRQELQNFIEQAVEENPFLEDTSFGQENLSESSREDEGGDDAEEIKDAFDGVNTFDSSDGADFESTEAFDDSFSEGESLSAEPLSNTSDFSEENQSLWSRESSPSGASSSSSSKSFDDNEMYLEKWAKKQKSFYEQLEEDIALTFKENRKRLVASYLLLSLDEKGYIEEEELEKLSRQLKVNQKEIEDVLFSLQKIAPAGVFARDLKECLTLQLQRSGKMSPIYAHILDNLEALGQGKFSKVGKKIGLDIAGMEDALKEIRFLKAHPLREIESAAPQTIVPDILVRPSDKEGFLVTLNPQVQPKITLNRSYQMLVGQKGVNKETKKYMSSHLAEANFIMRAVSLRLDTIFRVATAIVEEQKVFMKYGLEHLKPMGLKQISEQLGIHESTVSRAVNGKYMSTPVGLFDMRWFFTQRVSTIFGHEGLSQKAVKDKICQMVHQEDAVHPLSDEEIRLRLYDEGIELARRTVAKYREQEKIPPASRRRRR